MCVSAVPAGLEEDVRSPGTGVTASVSCHVGIRNWTRTLWKRSNCLAVYPAPKWSYILLSFLSALKSVLNLTMIAPFPHSTEESQWLVADTTNVTGFKSVQLFVVPFWTGLFILFGAYECLAACVPCGCLAPTETGRHWDSWNSLSGWLWAIVWAIGRAAESSQHQYVELELWAR